MQTAYFPMRYLRITQAYGSKTSTHKYGYPVDNAGKDTRIDGAWAPFDGVVKKIYKLGHSVWLESTEKVLYADGTKDYMTVMFTHDDNVSNLKVGQVIKQWTTFYQEGTNNASGNHVHIEVTKGKFKGSGWYKAPNGQWVTNNPYKPEKAFVLKDVTVLATGGLTWIKYKAPTPAPKPTPTPSKGDYKVVKSIKGYVSSADAKARKNSNSTVSSGTYYTYNTAAGMRNISRTKGQPGWWINPGDNVTPSAPAKKYYTVKKGDSLSVIASRNGLTLAKLLALAENAKYRKNPNLINPGDKVRVK